MKKQSIKKNFIFQILYQFIILVLPLITSPYLTRVLGGHNLGIYVFSYSIGYYFVIAAMLGIAKYGQRIIASRRNDENSLRKTFWSLYYAHLIFSLVSLAAYLFFCLFQKDNKTIFFIQAIYVASALFDITWLFYGLENFKSVVIKNLFVKFTSTLLIFLFVKNPSDLWIYTLIMSCSFFAGQFSLLPQAIKLIHPVKICWNNMKEHFKPLFVLSVAVIAASLYTMFDKTLIGIFINEDNVAYYEYAYKIIQIPTSIIAVIGTVLFPRSCACYASGDIKGMKNYFKLAIIFTFFISIGSIFGLICVSDLFVELYYGSDFLPSSLILKTLTPLILIVMCGDIVRMQFLIPMKKDTAYILIAVFNAVLNLSISCILLPLIGVEGAVVGTISAELFGLIFQSIVCRKYIDWLIVIKYLLLFFMSGLVMIFAIFIIKNIFNDGWFALSLQVGFGMITYFIVSFLLVLVIERKQIIVYLRKKL